MPKIKKKSTPTKTEVLYEIDWDKVESIEDIKELLRYLLWFVGCDVFTERFIEFCNIPKKIWVNNFDGGLYLYLE